MVLPVDVTDRRGVPDPVSTVSESLVVGPAGHMGSQGRVGGNSNKSENEF